MSWIIFIIIGGLIGWIASAIMRTRQSILADIFVGILGSVLGVWFFSNVLGIGPIVTAGTISFWGIVWSILGAVILIAILEAIRPSRQEMIEEEMMKQRMREQEIRMRERALAHEYEEEMRKKKKKEKKIKLEASN